MADAETGYERANAGLSRRTLIAGAAAVGAAAGFGTAKLGAPNGTSETDEVAFIGPHQPGITTNPQSHLHFAAFDFTSGSASELAELLRSWTSAAALLMRGEPAGRTRAPELPPADPGEALGLSPTRLTLTFGVGPTIFEANAQDRLGLRNRMPTALRPLPPFRGDALHHAQTGGDLCIQACSDDAQVAFHAVHTLTRTGAGAATPRWSQQGFREAASSDRRASHRNLFGFNEGTRNLDTNDAAALREHVWVKERGPHSRWMNDGTYLVTRRIRMLFDVWDLTTLHGQERTIGRHKASGAPLGSQFETAPLGLQRRSSTGELAIPENAHVRLAAPQTNHGAQLLRRSYSIANGIEPQTGQIDAGLLFICFQRDPHHHFVPIQHRLSQHDALNKHILHTGSALFACPPGARTGGFIGEGLFDPL